jgi:ribonuclease P/MRP protein subunit RPP40
MLQQHGFFKNRSTQTTHVDNNLQVDVLYTDFEKAFDKINLTKLLKKLRGIGIGGKLLKLISSYLSDRKMQFILNGCLSREFTATLGVPQGSHLGPLFFIIYLNDIAGIFKNSNFIVYADDLKVWKAINDEKNSHDLQDDTHWQILGFCRDKNL